MSAVLSNAQATFTFAGANIHLAMASPQELIEALAKFGIQTAANDAPKAETPKPTSAPKPAATPAPTAAPVAGGNASASTATPASAPPADAGSAPAGDPAVVPTYDDVRQRVLALSKISRETCLGILGQFKGVSGAAVDHGNKLQLPDYAAFIAAADKVLKPAEVAA